jgi:biofilm PGA synthesis N-glycosyltransferase PgaC
VSEFFEHAGRLLSAFAFYYPLFMAGVWIVGAFVYAVHWEHRSQAPDQPPELARTPGVSFLVPCRNEAAHIRETVAWLLAQDYPELEVITINDASTDETGPILDELARGDSRVRVVHLLENQGKAAGLRMGSLVSRHEYLICVDGDALLDPHATRWMMHHLITGNRVGAVTGNPRIRNRSTLLGKVQVGEFSAIIGMLKRAQRVYGRIFTATGAVSGYRKAALHRSGYWSSNTVTEDLDISWRLQTDGWDIRYEPNALCWILMPETLRGLWQQRLRWAQGGVEALVRYSGRVLTWRCHRMWGVWLEHVTSLAWSVGLGLLILLWLVSLVVDLPGDVQLQPILPEWAGVMLGSVCLAQFVASLWLDGRYEKGLARYYYWMIWYPVLFWIIGMSTAVVAIPKTLFGNRNGRGVWTSPDRGLR